LKIKTPEPCVLAGTVERVLFSKIVYFFLLGVKKILNLGFSDLATNILSTVFGRDVSSKNPLG
jgi:hypothetical protein